MNILIIDDDPLMLEVLSQQLMYIGHRRVTTSEAAADALPLLEADNSTFDLVFCDLQMPGMDGVEFLRHLSSIKFPGCLVLISGEDIEILKTVELLGRSLNLNVLSIVSKPMNSAKLGDVFKQYATRRRGSVRRQAQLDRRAEQRKAYSADDIKHAINANELVNYYQPKIELRRGEFAGVESLVRWQHPDDGMVYPDQFIATAEASNLINLLTLSVLNAALQQTVLWQQAGIELKVAVNISMLDLNDLKFPDVVQAALKAANVDAHVLMLEITESQLSANMTTTLDIISRLRLKRIQISIDDFGTGHSSLTQLRDFPFNELKVDNSFVHGASNDAIRRTIFQASMTMAAKLGLQAVAEGVENEDDLHFVKNSKCNQAQGYFIGRPMPAEDLPAWIAEWTLRRPSLFHTLEP
jgi:EAL domain-containing protein (putative c-di-GMP-specific phosphodiesterase class I)/DNA-binding NarL/FixJ family response regulator